MDEHARLGRVKMICDYSGFAGYDDEMVKTWNGFYVLRRFAGEETQRHPQEITRTVRERVPGVTRPEATETYGAEVLKTTDGIPIVTASGLPITTTAG